MNSDQRRDEEDEEKWRWGKVVVVFALCAILSVFSVASFNGEKIFSTHEKVPHFHDSDVIFRTRRIVDNQAYKNPNNTNSTEHSQKKLEETVKTVLVEARSFTWENGLVYYRLTNYSKTMANLITISIQDFKDRVNSGSNNHTCIDFKRFNASDGGNRNYVNFFPGKKCDSTVGRPINEKNKNVSLGPSCLNNGTIQHELMHILGFWHEQSRTDRDRYVKIQWEHILEKSKDNFRKYSDPVNDHLGLPYDYGSIMHYNSKAFTKDGNDTILPVYGKPGIIGQRDRPSELDLLKVRLRYNCSKHLNESVYRKLLTYPIPLSADDNAPYNSHN